MKLSILICLIFVLGTVRAVMVGWWLGSRRPPTVSGLVQTEALERLSVRASELTVESVKARSLKKELRTTGLREELVSRQESHGVW